MLAFHGFNRSADDFRVLEPALAKEFTVISFNLFYYGRSHMETGKEYSFDYEDLRGLIRIIMEERKIDRFSLLGYSLGGRIALACLELFAEKVELLLLFASDGIRMNRWYSLFTRNWLLRRLYKRIIKKPNLFYKLADNLRSRGYISESLYSFAVYHMQDEEKRRRIYDVWMVFRKIIPNIAHIVKLINRHNCEVHLFFGRYDRVIPVEIGRSFAGQINGKGFLHVINTGHNLITPGINKYITDVISRKK
jgi:pimeloyl-ACP methyl ester carboxylesterase